MRIVIAALVACLLIGCSDADAVSDSGAGGSGGSTVTPFTPDAGLGEWLCQPGELPLGDGSCLPAGVPAEACGTGFMAVDDGCEPVLPASPCAKGTMAIMGETSCRAVAPCGNGNYGDIPTDGVTQFVDLAYTGGNNDGSQTAPWTSVQQGVDAAVDGAIVAIAAGDYVEGVVVSGKRVRLWGRCPEMVEIYNDANAAIAIRSDGSEVRDLAVNAPDRVALNVGMGATGVIIDRVWVHDAGLIGVDIETGSPEATVTRSLIEDNHGIGVFGMGARVVLEDSVVRNTLPRTDGSFGDGIRVWRSDADVPTTLEVRRVLVDKSYRGGIETYGSNATIEETVVRDVQPEAIDEDGGCGICVHDRSSLMAESNVTVSASHVSDTHFAGIFVENSQASVDTTVVRNVLQHPRAPASYGIGVIRFDDHPNKVSSTVRSSLVEQTRLYGVGSVDADLLIEAVIVRDTDRVSGTLQVGKPDVGGRGIGVEGFMFVDERHSLVARGVRVERTHEMGIVAMAADMVVENALVSEVAARETDGFTGRGIVAQATLETRVPASAIIRDSLVEHTHDHGIIVFDSVATIESVWIRDTAPTLDGWGGRGIGVQGAVLVSDPTTATIKRVVVENSHDTGILVAGADVTISNSVVRDTHAQPIDGFYGDGVIALPTEEIQMFGNQLTGSTVTIADSLIESSHRVGVATWGSYVAITSTLLSCNAIDLNGEMMELDFQFDDQGGNVCGCGEQIDECRAVSDALGPPNPAAPQ